MSERLSAPTSTEVSFPEGTNFTPLSVKAGGMGLVFFCHEKTSDRSLVLKTFRPELLHNREQRIRFMQEVCDWIFLGAHPNIVQAFRVESLGLRAQPYLVLEAVEGAALGDDVSLAHILQSMPNHQLPIQASLKVTLNIVRAMIHATSRIDGLVHRDIKPANILLDRNGVAKLTDFGVARSFTKIDTPPPAWLADQSQASIDSYVPAGSPHYIAPEQWSTKNIRATPQVDMYALGLTLYEMLIGQKRAFGKSIQELKGAHIDSKLAVIPDSVPSKLKELLNKCCAYSPGARFSNWQSLEAALCDCYESLLNKSPPALAPVLNTQQDASTTIDSYLTVAQSYQTLGLLDIALEYGDLALTLAEQKGLNVSIVTAKILIAELNEEAGNRSAAINLLQQALKATRIHKLSVAEHTVLMLLGSYLHRDGEDKRAGVCFEESLRLARASGDAIQTAVALGNRANLLAENGNLAAAIIVFKEQREVFKIAGDLINLGKCSANLGIAYFDYQDYVSAIDQLSQGLAIAKEFADTSGQMQSLKYLYLASKRQNNPAKMQHWLDAFLTLANEWNYPDEIAWAKAESTTLSGQS